MKGFNSHAMLFLIFINVDGDERRNYALMLKLNNL